MLKPASRMIAPSTTTTKMATPDVEERDQLSPSCSSEPTPYLPTVKATAPSTPKGASRTMKPMILNRIRSPTRSMCTNTGFPRSPRRERPAPNRIAISSTCRMSPLAKASTMVVGMIFMRNPTVPP